MKDTFKQLIQHESLSGVLLFACAILAIILANSPLAPFYFELQRTIFSIKLGDVGLEKHLIEWVNDGLMALFFFGVGLEIKREILGGHLNSLTKLSFPFLAALSGMVFPALIYTLFNHGDPIAIRGWGIPVATDIAFSLGILTLVGAKVPRSLVIFLLALAIIDDIGAIGIIAIFYTRDLSTLSMSLGALAVLALFILNKFNVKRLVPYSLLGIVLWVCVLKSGVHATLAGVLLAFLIPYQIPKYNHSPLLHAEHTIMPWNRFFILPLFALFNSGFQFADLTPEHLVHPVSLGIICGLFFGKQLGIVSICWLGTKLRLSQLPTHIKWSDIYGISLLCGVGFTMSLFIGSLAFQSIGEEFMSMMKISVIIASLLSGLAGYLILRHRSNHSW